MNESVKKVFFKRKITYLVIFATLIAVYVISASATEFHLSEGLASFPKAMAWIGHNLMPDEKAMLSVAVTVIAAIFAFCFSLFGSKATGFNGIVNRIVRIVAAFFRNVPDVVWAMLLMFSFGQNILTGFFALFFTTFGLLTRAFIETIDEVSAAGIEALNASGANFIQTVFQAIIPSAMPGIVTWILYMIETNIRNSTLIGILTATGIGYLFDLYYKRLDFSSASLVVVSIIVLVIAIELVSNLIRKVIL